MFHLQKAFQNDLCYVNQKCTLDYFVIILGGFSLLGGWVCWPGGSSCWEGACWGCACPVGCLLGVPAQGMCLPGGACPEGPAMGVPAQGGTCLGGTCLGGCLPRGLPCDLSHHAFDATCMLSHHQLRPTNSAVAYILLVGHVTCKACWDTTPSPVDRILDTCF